MNIIRHVITGALMTGCAVFFAAAITSRPRKAIAHWWKRGPARGPGLAPHIPHPDLAPARPQLTDGEEALLIAIESPVRHPLATSNGRKLADTLRQDVPGLTDIQLAQVCIVLTLHASAIDGIAATENRWLVFTDALAMGAVELAALERTDAP